MLFGKKDLIDRWIYSRQGVYKALGWPDFPTPYLTADNGRLDAWQREHIEAFELRHPELTDEAAKAMKSRDRSRKRAVERLRPQIAQQIYLGPRDITNRWYCTRQQTYKAIASSNIFPKPSFVFNQGKSRVWDIALIEELEEKYKGNPVMAGAFDSVSFRILDRTKDAGTSWSFYPYPNTVAIDSDESRRVAEAVVPIPNPDYRPTLDINDY